MVTTMGTLLAMGHPDKTATDRPDTPTLEIKKLEIELRKQDIEAKKQDVELRKRFVEETKERFVMEDIRFKREQRMAIQK